MYIAKVEAEALERELKEALKQQETQEKKKRVNAKEQHDSLAQWAIQNTSEWKAWTVEKQREAWAKQLKEAKEAE